MTDPIRIQVSTPQGSQTIELTGQARADYLAAKAATADVDTANLAGRFNARQQLLDQFASGMAQIQSDLTLVQQRKAAGGTLTAVEVREGMLHILTSLKWLGDRLADGTIPVSLPSAGVTPAP